MITLVRVAKFRDETDHLHRLAHVDYHACASVSEVENWKETAARVLAQVEGMTCNRASAYDRDQFAKAIEAVQSQLVAADTRIASLKARRDSTMSNSAAAAIGLIPKRIQH